MSMAAFKALTVDSFPSSARRPMLMRTLQQLTSELDTLLVPYELWLNGSYLSQKQEPDDIDLTIIIHSFYFNKLDFSTQDAIVNLNQTKSFDGFLHMFVCIQYPEDDPRAKGSGYDYWAFRWQVDWENFLKGFAIVKLGGN